MSAYLDSMTGTSRFRIPALLATVTLEVAGFFAGLVGGGYLFFGGNPAGLVLIVAGVAWLFAGTWWWARSDVAVGGYE